MAQERTVNDIDGQTDEVHTPPRYPIYNPTKELLMKWCTLVPAVSMVVLCSAPALAQDAVTTDPAHYKVLFENASVRILKIDYAVGAKSKMHKHPDAIV